VSRVHVNNSQLCELRYWEQAGERLGVRVEFGSATDIWGRAVPHLVAVYVPSWVNVGYLWHWFMKLSFQGRSTTHHL
jgi:hypothetical protein